MTASLLDYKFRVFLLLPGFSMLIRSKYEILLRYKWVKVFKNRTSKICGRQPLKNLKVMWWYGPFLNTLTQISVNLIVCPLVARGSFGVDLIQGKKSFSENVNLFK